MDGECCDMNDIITQCKLLKYFRCFFEAYSTVVPNQCLQHFHITSHGINISDVFMDSVSSHGGLESVTFSAFSVTIVSITAVIRNSPKL